MKEPIASKHDGIQDGGGLVGDGGGSTPGANCVTMKAGMISSGDKFGVARKRS